MPTQNEVNTRKRRQRSQPDRDANYPRSSYYADREAEAERAREVNEEREQKKA